MAKVGQPKDFSPKTSNYAGTTRPVVRDGKPVSFSPDNRILNRVIK